MTTNPTFLYRPSETRGGGIPAPWLKTFHTFSFADYWDPRFDSFGSLRVINEDRVAPGQGFPPHPHREAEIFSYILDGDLAHKDSMGNTEVCGRGDVQMTSGGTGIRHSEFNGRDDKEVHFLQIWALPNKRGLKPAYYTRHFTDADKADKWAHVVAPVGWEGVVDEREGKGPTPIHSALHFYASVLSPGKSVDYKLLDRLSPSGPGTKRAYVQLTQMSGYNARQAPKDGKAGAVVKVKMGLQEATLGEGDGVFITGVKTGDELIVENIGEKKGEVVMFDIDE